MFYNVLAAGLLGSSSGCMSQLVEAVPARKSAIAGVGWIDYGRGEIKYAVDSWGWVTSLRRRAALRRIRKFCKGRGYKIAQEFEKREVAVPYSSDDVETNMKKGLAHYSVDLFEHMVFECSPPEGESVPLPPKAVQPPAAEAKPPAVEAVP
ncbi:MAG: hypothetical protein HY927_08070 [Elusimicrobia bacterium]|nr:hypothetical protein [Elusimicrobiota bacterium]